MDEMITAVDNASVVPVPADQILTFAQSANPESIRDVASWTRAGINIPHTITPFEGFSEQMDLEFPSLTRDAQEALLRDSFRMVFGDFPERGRVHNSPSFDYWTRQMYLHRDQFVLFSGGVFNRSGLFYTENIAIYLEKALEMTGGNLEATKAFLSSVPAIKYPRTQESLARCLSFLYKDKDVDELPRPNTETVRLRGIALDIRSRFQGSNPKAKALAFWADTKFGTFDLEGRNADVRIADVLAEDDPSLKTEVLKYLKEQLLTDAPGYAGKHAFIERAIGNQRALYLALKDKYPDSSFVQDYEMIQRLLKLRRMESRLREDTITPKDLITLLAFYPTLISQVSTEEINNAINTSEDPDVIKSLRELFLRKRALENASNPNPIDESSQ